MKNFEFPKPKKPLSEFLDEVLRDIARLRKQVPDSGERGDASELSKDRFIDDLLGALLRLGFLAQQQKKLYAGGYGSQMKS